MAGGFDIGVPEPFFDDGDIVSAFDEVERGGVPEDVRRDFLVVYAGAFLGGGFGVEFYATADPKAGERFIFVVEEEVVGVDACVLPCLKVGLDILDGFFPEGDGAGFLSFAGEGDGCGGVEAQVAYA